MKFTPEVIQAQRELISYATYTPWRVLWEKGMAYLMNCKNWQMAGFTIGAGKMPDAVAAAVNNYPAALDEIERLTTERDAANEARDQASMALHVRHVQYNAAQADAERLAAALKLCFPLVQNDVYELDNDNVCYYCGAEINSGDEHKDDCRQVVAYLAAKNALTAHQHGEG